VEINFDSKPGLMKNMSSHSMDRSGHSFDRSVLSFDQKQFEDDAKIKRFLRYMRILPPNPYEKPAKKRIRIYTWSILILDFIAAMVAITTYDGVTTCCGVSILSPAANINWNSVIRVTTYVYLAAIFLEIIPVLRKGIPFNLLNPLMGFAITFAMFFDDRIPEAICMWLIEVSAIFLEFLVYRIKSRHYHEREARLARVDKDLEPFKYKSSRKNAPVESLSDDSDDDSLSGDSFGNEDEEAPRTSGPGGNHLTKLRLLRERRILRQTQTTDRVQLRYHFAGVAINLSFVGISMILILSIAVNGGLCFKDMKTTVFESNQLEKCSACKGTSGVCEVCNDDGSSECYYPYY
jgi:hypothetical protein